MIARSVQRAEVPSRPRPVPDAASRPFWSAASHHRLALARCSVCSTFALPAEGTCPHCLSTEPAFTYEPVRGEGHLRSWTVVRKSFLPGFEAEMPFVLADVELHDAPGLRMIGRLLDGPGSQLHAGLRVMIAFEDVADDLAVPAFALADHT